MQLVKAYTIYSNETEKSKIMGWTTERKQALCIFADRSGTPLLLKIPDKVNGHLLKEGVIELSSALLPLG